MRFFAGLILLLSFASAASFNSPVPEKELDESDFPDYQGDRTLLNTVLYMSGSVARLFYRHARCMDELLSDEHIISFMTAVSYLEPEQQKTLGWILREISPQRFDSIISRFYYPVDARDNLVAGYPNEESLWKKSTLLSKSDPVTPENAAYYPFVSLKVCHFMRYRPDDILHRDVLEACVEHWIQSGEAQIVRKLVWEMKNLARLDEHYYRAFIGHEDEFVDWFKVAMTDGRLQKVKLSFGSLILPNKLQLGPEHLAEMKEFIQGAELMSAPHLHINCAHESSNVREFNSFTSSMCHLKHGVTCALDDEPFLDCLVLAKPPMNSDLSMAENGFPKTLNEACGDAIAYGVYEPIENTIRLIYCVDRNDPRQTITEVFWMWYYNSLFNMGMDLERMKHLMSIIKPHLTEIILPDDTGADEPYSVGEDDDTRLQYLPLYLDMQKHMDAYWPAGLVHAESGRTIEDWVRSRIEAMPTDREKFLEQIEDSESSDHFAYALSQGWTDICKERKWTGLVHHLDHNLFTALVEFYGFADFRNRFSHGIVSLLPRNLAWIALSSNYQLLDDYLELFTPQFLSNQCAYPSLKRRINLMLHLSHKTHSYLSDGTEVEKNSLFFRDWVYCRLWSEFLADLKLLHYYHLNRIAYRRYNADPIGVLRILGLQGDYHGPHDPARVEDLSFDTPEVEEMEVEEVEPEEKRGMKRARSEDGAAEGEPERKVAKHD